MAVMDLASIPEETLQMIDRAMENLKAGEASGPVDLGETMAHPTEPKSIFDDRALFGPKEAVSLKVRSKLMNRLTAYVEERGLSQEEAAVCFDTTQPRISNLLKGKMSKFSMDALLVMCTAAGIEVEVCFPGTRVV